MERTVELVGFNDHVFTVVRQQQVGAIILRDASQKGVAAYMGLVQQMGCHGGSGGLAVSAGYAKSFPGAGKHSQYL